MYAIVEIQGQQFKVEEGRKLFVHHIREAEQGAEVTFDRVMLLDKDGAVTVGVPTVEGAQVVCEVVSPIVKGEKVLIFKDHTLYALTDGTVVFSQTRGDRSFVSVAAHE